MSVRCVDGPYAGQVFAVDIPWPAVFEQDPQRADFVVGPLCWIVNGPDWHGYRLRTIGAGRNTFPHSFCLVYDHTVRPGYGPSAQRTVVEYGDEPYERLPEVRRVTATVP